MFKQKRMIPLSYDRQGYIYFVCKNYARLPKRQQETIRKTAEMACGDYADPVLRFVTTDDGALAVCRDAFISEPTLYRAVRRFYLDFPRWI